MEIKVIINSFFLYWLLSNSIVIGQVSESSRHVSDTTFFKVYKIDSVNQYYTIYARNNEAIFKIISKKNNEILKARKIIKINKCYRLDPKSLLFINGKPIIPANQINEIFGWRIDDSTTINFEGDSIRNLYISDRLKGLSYLGSDRYGKACKKMN